MVDQKPGKNLGCMAEKRNVGDRLKRFLAKFQANPSSPLGVNGRSQISKNSQKNRIFAIFSQSSNGRLPQEDSSDWPETWPKCVSDDPQHFIF